MDIKMKAMKYEPIPVETENVARSVVDCALTVHKALGPGLLESVYEACLCHELKKRGVPFKAQVVLPVTYDGMRLETGLRLDVLVSDSIIVEIKAVETMHPLFDAQLLTYLKLTGLRLGLLLNFNVVLIKDGIKRMAL